MHAPPHSHKPSVVPTGAASLQSAAVSGDDPFASPDIVINDSSSKGKNNALGQDLEEDEFADVLGSNSANEGHSASSARDQAGKTSLEAYTQAHDSASNMLSGYTTALGLVIDELPGGASSRQVFARHFDRCVSLCCYFKCICLCIYIIKYRLIFFSYDTVSHSHTLTTHLFICLFVYLFFVFVLLLQNSVHD